MNLNYCPIFLFLSPKVTNLALSTGSEEYEVPKLIDSDILFDTFSKSYF